jgi:hypothetical protein
MELQLSVISKARELKAVGVSRSWLGLMLQSGVTLKLDFSLQRSPAAQDFWRAQLSAPGVCLRLLLSAAAGAPAPDMGWLFHASSYPGITHLVSGACCKTHPQQGQPSSFLLAPHTPARVNS